MSLMKVWRKAAQNPEICPNDNYLTENDTVETIYGPNELEWSYFYAVGSRQSDFKLKPDQANAFFDRDELHEEIHNWLGHNMEGPWIYAPNWQDNCGRALNIRIYIDQEPDRRRFIKGPYTVMFEQQPQDISLYSAIASGFVTEMPKPEELYSEFSSADYIMRLAGKDGRWGKTMQGDKQWYSNFKTGKEIDAKEIGYSDYELGKDENGKSFVKDIVFMVKHPAVKEAFERFRANTGLFAELIGENQYRESYHKAYVEHPNTLIPEVYHKYRAGEITLLDGLLAVGHTAESAQEFLPKTQKQQEPEPRESLQPGIKS